jgi:tetratricopeptide (TPR) repeat protein
MHSYGVRDVQRVVRLSRGTIRTLISGGFVSPSRGPRREYRFSFQDLLVLRTAGSLAQAKVPAARIHRALRELRARLPDTVPICGLAISALGDNVVVRTGHERWQADSGQYLLELDVSVRDGVLSIVERLAPPPRAAEPVQRDQQSTADDWYERGMALEEQDAEAAQAAYEQCVALEPSHVAARINLGRLLQQRNELERAEGVYRDGTRLGLQDPLLWFNFAVLADDLGRTDEAIAHYRAALALDPNLADAHYNLARLHEARGEAQQAIRHFGRYRRLTAAR